MTGTLGCMSETTSRVAVSLLVVGDSLSEGVGDPAPGLGWLRGQLHGWVHHLREHVERSRPVQIENLARRGARLRDVAELQLPWVHGTYDAAVCLVGVNDVLSRDFRGEAFASGYREVMGRLREVAPVVVVGTLHDFIGPLPIAPARKRLIRDRISMVNEVVHSVAAEPEALLLDMEAHQEEITRPVLTIDRLHPNRTGHRRLAHRMVALLEVGGVLESGGPAAAPIDGSRLARLANHAQHLAWLTLHSVRPFAVEAVRRLARRPGDSPRRSQPGPPGGSRDDVRDASRGPTG
jgi:lysophospholipase L1-like esterase